MEKQPVRHWRFVATLEGEIRATLRWSYLTDRLPRRSLQEKSSLFRILLKAADGRTLLVWPALAVPVRDCPDHAVLSGSIPWHAETALIEARRADLVLFEVRVPAQLPTLRLRRLEPGANGRARLRWDAEVAKGAPLRSSVFIELDDGRRYPLANHIEGRELEIDINQLPGCDHGRIVVRIADGVRTSEAATEPFELPPKPPLAWIGFPRKGTVVRSDQPVQVHGYGWDVQAQRPAGSAALEWILDGRSIGNGALLIVSRVLAGPHSLVLRVRDRGGRAALVETTFNVVPARRN